ncbi:conserved hypothetical protein [Candidatus Accumulibacter aalborgensis]|uniref:DUF488 domain-containing protein n=1 Tax=Candidatus Accumulibacter aalborgensis TaxID=1860102 RepID=A0A1A8XIS0_9PROT|nr:DUF488 domain-containing protein [Candidatus Accumulibacter aalborgensis]SBT03843.1 conserved hypothetical protein [Candidatus Accumulibacter aalborgensis]
MTAIQTIGHSNHDIDAFIGLLRLQGVTAIADVRSHPVSRRFPQFDKKVLQASLAAAGIRYVFLGEGLGARPRDPGCYVTGRADFDRIRASAAFAEALARLRRGAEDYRICLLCAERDPADCHRTWLVAQALHEAGAMVRHILADGSAEPHDALLRRVAGADSATGSLFDDEAELLMAAARHEAQRVAYCPDTQHSEDGGE